MHARQSGDNCYAQGLSGTAKHIIERLVKTRFAIGQKENTSKQSHVQSNMAENQNRKRMQTIGLSQYSSLRS